MLQCNQIKILYKNKIFYKKNWKGIEKNRKPKII